MIKTENLTKKYGELFAIKGIELDLQQGDLFGFIGPNGAGKTTTMRKRCTLVRWLINSSEADTLRWTRMQRQKVSSSIVSQRFVTHGVLPRRVASKMDNSNNEIAAVAAVEEGSHNRHNSPLKIVAEWH